MLKTTNALIGAWRFEGNANDWSGNGNNGTVFGATLTTGKFGQCYSFDGIDDYINLGAPATFNNLALNDMAILAWIYDSHTGAETWGTILGTYRITPKVGWIFRTFSNAGGSRSLHWEGDYTNNASYESTYGTIVVNTWMHVAVVWKASTLSAKLYINGKEPTYDHQTPGSGSYGDDSALNKQIGQLDIVGGIQQFNGRIDEVRVYNHTLTISEIKSAMLGFEQYEF